MILCDMEGSRKIGKPLGWDEELDGPCVTLPVIDHRDTRTGVDFMISLYRLTEAEMEILKAGGAIRLMVAGTRHPVISIDTVDEEVCRNSKVVNYRDLGEE